MNRGKKGHDLGWKPVQAARKPLADATGTCLDHKLLLREVPPPTDGSHPGPFLEQEGAPFWAYNLFLQSEMFGFGAGV